MIGAELLRAAGTTKPEAEEEIPKTSQMDFRLQMCLGLYDGLYIILCWLSYSNDIFGNCRKQSKSSDGFDLWVAFDISMAMHSNAIPYFLSTDYFSEETIVCVIF